MRSGLLHRHAFSLLLLLCGLGLGIWYWLGLHFQPEDAYITYRYSAHLAAGQGAIWNLSGPPVEGYSNFLWMLVLSLPARLGIPPETAAPVLGLALYGAVLVLSLDLARRLLPESAARWSLAWLAFHGSLAAFAVSGMETALHTLLLLLLVRITLLRAAVGCGFVKLGLVAALAILTRPDQGLMVAVILGWLAWKRAWNLRAVVRFTLPLFLLLLPWLVWKYSVYGNLLPNTYYAKAGSGSLRQGILYLGGWLAVLGLPLAALSRFRRNGEASTDAPAGAWSLLLGLVTVWCLGLVLLGGDFMEFRLLAPLAPLVSLLLARGLGQGWRQGILALLIVLEIVQATGFGRLYYTGFILPVPHLAAETGEPGQGTVAQGRALAGLFAQDTSLHIALARAGAIPYFSGLTCTDVLGLNDAWVARNGSPRESLPGHRRILPFRRLLELPIHLSHAWILEPGAPRPAVWHLSDPLVQDFTDHFPPQDWPRPPALVSYDTPEGFTCFWIYLRPHPAVEGALQSKKLSLWELKP